MEYLLRLGVQKNTGIEVCPSKLSLQFDLSRGKSIGPGSLCCGSGGSDGEPEPPVEQEIPTEAAEVAHWFDVQHVA